MKKASRSKTVKKLDTIFSIYIRRRFAVEDVAECFTCGVQRHYKELQCGHFQSRKNYATRWDPDNCRVQCYACNCMKYGEQYKFGLKLDKDHGKGLAESLLQKSKTTVKYSNDDLESLINLYNKLLIDLQ